MNLQQGICCPYLPAQFLLEIFPGQEDLNYAGYLSKEQGQKNCFHMATQLHFLI